MSIIQQLAHPARSQPRRDLSDETRIRFGAHCAKPLLSLCVAVFAGVCAAQTPPPAPGAPPPGDAAPAPPLTAATGMPPPPPPMPNAPPEAAPASSLPVASGTVRRFVINPDGDVDGLLLGDGSLVHVPPHLSTQLVSAIRTGDSVQIVGVRVATGDVTAQRIVDQRTGAQVIDQPPAAGALRPPPELRGAGLVRLTAQGEVLRVTTAPRGEPDGVLLRDGTVIKLTPPGAQQFIALLQPGVTVAASGYGTHNQLGEAMQATAFGVPGHLTQLYGQLPN